MHVAFFRNLNLGQRRSPTRQQLVDAFVAEGATDVLSHQGNGTVAFRAPLGRDPQAIADAVAGRLGPVCGWGDVVLVRPVEWLASLGLDDQPSGCELTLFDGPSSFPEALPWSPDAEVTVLRADHLHAIVLNHRERRSRGTPVVEARIERRATSRGVGTVQRLLARL